MSPSLFQAVPGNANALQGPNIRRGQLLIYRMYDIAEEIDLSAVERIVAADHAKVRLSLASAARGSRGVTAAEISEGQALIMRNPPLRLSLGQGEVLLAGELKPVEVSATLWDYGAVSIQLRFMLPREMTWTALLELSETLAVESPRSPEAIDGFCRRKSKELGEKLRTALKSPAERELYEDYVVFLLEELDGIRTGLELAANADLSALLLGERKERLSPKSRAGILEYAYQYAESDLAVIDWNSAILLEPSGQQDVADILEFAVTHLLELRYYDGLLDRRLAELYEQLGRGAGPIWKKRPELRRLSAEANRGFIEFSEFVERVDNSLKVVGDFYLAVIFRAAVRRFRISDWQGSVIRKMNLLARVSELLQGEANIRRGHFLEIIIIALIAFEIGSGLLKLF